MDLIKKINDLAGRKFDESNIQEFVEKFRQLSGNHKIIESLIQISIDEGLELEVGFFTSEFIVDITLSKGNVYFCTFNLSEIQSIDLTDAGSKWTLSIFGQKKFDYNVVKPDSYVELKKYETSLREFLEKIKHNLLRAAI